MRIGSYVRERISNLIFFVPFYVFFWLFGIAFHVQKEFLVAISVLLFVGIIGLSVYDYVRRRSFYNEFLEKLSLIEEKYYITEMIEPPAFQEGKILCESLYEIDKAMKEHINETDSASVEFKEYLEMWVHEMKVPLAGLNLMNYNKNMDFEGHREQLQRLQHYVEQVLFYARAGAAQKDYIMKKCSVEGIVNKVLVANKELLIVSKMRIEKQGLDAVIITDAKWLEFILGQIVNNSVKYRKGNQGVLRFSQKEEEKRIILEICDEGIGIVSQDVSRVFDKTFTGVNGRKVGNSTGMGLYICKKLCDRLGHDIWIESEEGTGTTVSIAFGKNAFYEDVV